MRILPTSGGCHATTVRGIVSAEHALEPERIPQALRDFCARTVKAVERSAEIPKELRPVSLYRGPKLIKHFDRQASRIRGVFNMSGGTALIKTAIETRSVP